MVRSKNDMRYFEGIRGEGGMLAYLPTGAFRLQTDRVARHQPAMESVLQTHGGWEGDREGKPYI